MSLNNEILKYVNNNVYPFHMPGHKRNEAFLLKNSNLYDFTEVHGLDNLHSPTSVIDELENTIAKKYEADKSFICVNGSSGGIMAAILACVGEGEKLLVARNCHRAAYSGIIFSGAVPIYMEVENNGSFACGVNPSTVEREILKHKNIKAVLLTSPTYEGIVSDIKKIADICHQYNILLIVDEAHGAHFVFHEKFPQSAIQCGADVVINSLHKTLPTYTQSAALHIKGTLVNKEKVKCMISNIQTTSPSYIFMAGIENCFHLLEDEKHFETYMKRLESCRTVMENLPLFDLLGKDAVGTNGIFDYDISKLVLFTNVQADFSMETVLRETYKIQIEASSMDYIIAMTSVADTEEGFSRLIYALGDINQNHTRMKNRVEKQVTFLIPEQKLTPKAAMFAPKKPVVLKDAVGQVSGEFIIPYPPGIPIVAPGEVITPEIFEFIDTCKQKGTSFIGTNDTNLDCIEIIF